MYFSFVFAFGSVKQIILCCALIAEEFNFIYVFGIRERILVFSKINMIAHRKQNYWARGLRASSIIYLILITISI